MVHLGMPRSNNCFYSFHTTLPGLHAIPTTAWGMEWIPGYVPLVLFPCMFHLVDILILYLYSNAGYVTCCYYLYVTAQHIPWALASVFHAGYVWVVFDVTYVYT